MSTEQMQRALLKWRNAYATHKQCEAAHRASVEQLEAAEYELAVVTGAAPPPQAHPVQPNSFHPYAPPPPPQYAPPPQPPPRYAPPPPAPAPQADTRPADEIVLEQLQNAGKQGMP